MVKFRLREENLKKKWHGKNDMVPVNAPQFIYVSQEKEEKFYKGMYPEEKEREIYENYRSEWYRRAKEFDAGEIPLSVNISTQSSMYNAIRLLINFKFIVEGMMLGIQINN